MTRLLLTPRWIAFTLVMAAAAVTCMVLGWWQFQRYQEGGGSFQNLGYTLNWPLFGAFAGYLWWRLLRDAGHADQAGHPDTVGGDPEPSAGDPQSPAGPDGAMRAAPAGTAGSTAASGTTRPETAPPATRRAEEEEPDDPELAAYNRYLAELAERARR